MKMKMWDVERRDAILPREWMRAVDAPSHVIQGDLLLFAPTKAALAEVLAERGMGELSAASLARSARWARDGRCGFAWEALISAGVIDPTRPGVYFAESASVFGRPIATVEPGGAVRIIATLSKGVDGNRYTVNEVTP